LLTLQVEEALSTFYNGDVNRISQILGNILSNALKFTDSGSVQLFVEADVSGICFRVADTGIGIEADSLEKIFEPFVQARSRGQTDRPGTGLGLTICKELSELMGGRIEVESKLGAGSTFRLYLPLQAVTEAASVAAVQSRGPLIERLKGKRVLLVEDVSLNRFLVEEMTFEWGIELEMALDGVEGLKKASDSTYDLILMDIQMPLMDGIQCTRAIRQLPDPERAAVPIIALSANAFESDRRNYLQAGMNDALSKPFDSTQLMGVLVRNLGAQTEGLKTQHDKEEHLASELTIDLTYLNRVGNGNPAFIKTMLKSFIESVDEITLEMEQMLAKGDRKSIGEAAHKLKFALGVVGVTALKNDVAFLEDQGKGYSEAAVDQEYTKVASGFIWNLRGLREQAGSKV
jgi:CheY-like chemotaxis protein/anti-sigma regulatory factor (Ser/Thr protein kinase)